MITVLFMFVLALVTPKQVAKAGDDAYYALHAFELVELTEYHAHHRWPTDDQHRHIVADCAVAADAVHDTLILWYDIQPITIGGVLVQPTSPQAHSLRLAQQQAVRRLDSMVDSTAPDDARKLMKKVRTAFDHLFALFPSSTFTERQK